LDSWHSAGGFGSDLRWPASFSSFAMLFEEDETVLNKKEESTT